MKTTRKSTLLLTLFSFIFLMFLAQSCGDKSEIRDLIRLAKENKRDKSFDCPKLKLNFKDECKTRDGKRGFVNRHCECEALNTSPDYDCPKLKLNFKDDCKTRDGKRGFVNRHCECEAISR
jgi:hypothetical protein